MVNTMTRIAPVSLIVLMTGCALFSKKEPEATFALYEQVHPALPASRVQQVEVPKTGLKIPISTLPTLTEYDVESAILKGAATGTAILLQFNMHGRMVLQETTIRARDNYLVIFLNNRPVAALRIDQPITNGQLLLEGDFGDEEAKQAVEAFNLMAKKQKVF